MRDLNSSSSLANADARSDAPYFAMAMLFDHASQTPHATAALSLRQRDRVVDVQGFNTNVRAIQ
ncbi:MAG: hypothetical protein AB1589_04110 [Cyanobacteriota bacterium]